MLALIAFAACNVIVVAQEPIRAAPTVPMPSAQHADAVATRFLEARNAHLVAGPTPAAAAEAMASAALAAAADAVPALTARESKTLEVLASRRAGLSAVGVGYDAARTQVTVRRRMRVGATVVARVNERTEFDYTRVHGDEPHFMAHSVDRDFTFERSGDRWLLAHVALTNPGHIPPENEVDAAESPTTDH